MAQGRRGDRSPGDSAGTRPVRLYDRNDGHYRHRGLRRGRLVHREPFRGGTAVRPVLRRSAPGVPRRLPSRHGERARSRAAPRILEHAPPARTPGGHCHGDASRAPVRPRGPGGPEPDGPRPSPRPLLRAEPRRSPAAMERPARAHLGVRPRRPGRTSGRAVLRGRGSETHRRRYHPGLPNGVGHRRGRLHSEEWLDGSHSVYRRANPPGE